MEKEIDLVDEAILAKRQKRSKGRAKEHLYEARAQREMAIAELYREKTVTEIQNRNKFSFTYRLGY